MNAAELHNRVMLFAMFFFVVLYSSCKTLPYYKDIFLHSFCTAEKHMECIEYFELHFAILNYIRNAKLFIFKPNVSKLTCFPYVCAITFSSTKHLTYTNSSQV